MPAGPGRRKAARPHHHGARHRRRHPVRNHLGQRRAAAAGRRRQSRTARSRAATSWIPAQGTTLEETEGADRRLDRSTGKRKSNRTQPDRARLDHRAATDSKMPMYGIASLERRMGDAHDMGGMQQKRSSCARQAGAARARRRPRAVRRRGLVVVAGRVESHRLRGRQGRSLGRRAPTAATRGGCSRETSRCRPGRTTARRSPSPKRRTAAAAGTSASSCCRSELRSTK